MYRVAENFQWRKLSRIGEKYDFRGENFRRLLALATPKDTTPQNFMEKTFKISHKTPKFAKVFSLESFPLYGMFSSSHILPYAHTSFLINIHLLIKFLFLLLVDLFIVIVSVTSVLH